MKNAKNNKRNINQYLGGHLYDSQLDKKDLEPSFLESSSTLENSSVSAELRRFIAPTEVGQLNRDISAISKKSGSTYYQQLKKKTKKMGFIQRLKKQYNERAGRYVNNFVNLNESIDSNPYMDDEEQFHSSSNDFENRGNQFKILNQRIFDTRKSSIEKKIIYPIEKKAGIKKNLRVIEKYNANEPEKVMAYGSLTPTREPNIQFSNCARPLNLNQNK